MAGMTGSSAYALSKSFTNKSLSGAGALKGKSAYELAVEQGFSGTLEEWLESLKGKDGTGFDYEQTTESAVWTINHNLGNRFPNIVCVDEDGDVIFGDITYYNENVTMISFGNTPKKGYAHLTQSGGAAPVEPGTGGGDHVILDMIEFEALQPKDPTTVYFIRG